MIFLFAILAILFFVAASFLGKELLKKFAFMREFIARSNQVIEWTYSGERKPGMYTIVLRGKKPFCALVGFRLRIPVIHFEGFDYYGFVQSDEQNTAVIATYLGKKPCAFQFFVNTELESNPILVTSDKEDQALMAHATYRPHWFQRMGF